MYSYDWLENAFGLGIRSADRVHERWQQRAEAEAIDITLVGERG
jgi:hypothetical protein